MHMKKVGKNSTILCLTRDEFIYVVKSGMGFLKEKSNYSGGLPYLADDLHSGYFNFSIMPEKEYREVVNAEKADK